MLSGMLVVLMAVGGAELVNNDSPFAWMTIGTDSASYQLFIGEEVLFGVEANPAEKENGRDYYLLNGGIDFLSIQALFSLEIEVLGEEDGSLIFKAVTLIPKEKGGMRVSTYKYVLN